MLQRCGASGLVNCPYANCHNTVQLREKCVQHSTRGFSISTALFSANTQPPSALGCMSPTGIVASTKPCNFYITTSHCPSFLISTLTLHLFQFFLIFLVIFFLTWFSKYRPLCCYSQQPLTISCFFVFPLHFSGNALFLNQDKKLPLLFLYSVLRES